MFAVTLLTFGIFSWFAIQSHRQLEASDKFYLALSDLKGTIAHLDEVLTMLATMAAATGESFWEARYRNFAPELDSAIQKAYRIGQQFDMAQMVSATNLANQELVKLENSVFELVRNNRLADARAILSSEKYQIQKETYRLGHGQLAGKITEKAKTDYASIQKRGTFLLFSMLVLLPTLFFFWYLALYNTRKFYRQREKLIASLVANEKELSTLVATKGKLFSIIAHDLKSPFNSIIGFSEILLENYHELKDEELGEYLRLLKKSSQQAFNLLENLLAWALSQTGKISYKPEVIEIKAKILKNIQLFERLAAEKKLEIKVEIEENLKVIGDRNMISTVLRNLITNAIKFTPEAGKVSISAERTNGEVEIRVNDTGVGIPTEALPKLFDPTAIYSTKGTSNEKGTGLGLILCKEFVEKQGGKIWVESVEGKGSSFRIVLPVAEMEIR